MPLTLPFAHLNLRRNPFGEVAAAERAALAVVDLEPALAFLRGGERRAVQWIGPSGRGKTTHLLALQARLRAPYLRLHEDGRLPPHPRRTTLLVDELQHAAPRTRRRLYRRSDALAIGTHEDLGAELERAGYAVRTARVGGALDVGLLREIARRRLEWARRGPGPLPAVPQATCARLLEQHGDDLRGIEHHLYELFQRLESIRDVEV